MSAQIASYLNSMSVELFLRQVIVIACLFVLGLSLTGMRNDKRIDMLAVLTAFPVGLSIYSLLGLILLTVGIPFNVYSITGGCAVIALIGLLVRVVNRGKNVSEASEAVNIKIVMTVSITMLCIIVISCSGLLSISVSNDSLYYYSMYPKAMVTYGELRKQFNVFLTDVGQCSALVGTLPFMYGFNESFGIQMFLNINTILLVAAALYEYALRRTDRRMAIVSAIAATLLLCVQQPYIVMNKWIMANGYFMNYMFICCYIAVRYASDISSASKNEGIRRFVVTGILFAMLSQLRMEGCILALLIIVCISTLEYTNVQLFTGFVLPIAAISIMYDIKIFMIMKIDAPYTFLTRTKAMIQLAAIVVIAVYVLVIRGRLFMGIQKRLPAFTVIMLIAVNVVLFIYDRELYAINLKSFINNISNQSGWGIFPMLIIGLYAMCFIASKRGSIGYSIWDMLFVTYVLAALAVSFAREDALVENLADSGNRVLLQVTIIGYYAVILHVIDMLFPSVEDATGNL